MRLATGIFVTEQDLRVRKAGILPDLTLLLGIGVVLTANRFFQLPG